MRHVYTSHGKGSSKLSRMLKGMFSYSPSVETVTSHMGLLIGQAVFLVLLAIVHVGIEARTIQLQASVPVIQRPQAADEIADASQGQNVQNTFGQADVLGENDEAFVDPVVKDYYSEPTPEPTRFNELPKEFYSIALFGDSMVDTFGEDGGPLKEMLEEKYPGTQFVIFNYGIGATNAQQGLELFHEPFDHNGRTYRSVDRLSPDIIIVGSYGYNVFDPPDRNMHWINYTLLVQEALTITPNVYMLAEIAPLRSGFGLGADGIVWEPQNAWTYTGHIINQLENVIGLSDALNVPLIDAYTPSLEADRKEGKRELIDVSDNIHPSVAGHEFIAEKIVETVHFEDVR